MKRYNYKTTISLPQYNYKEKIDFYLYILNSNKIYNSTMSIINSLSLYNSVIIKHHPIYTHSGWKDKTFRYEGTVKNVKDHYKNQGAKHWGKDKNVYIGFMKPDAYHNLLLQGSKIFCVIHGSSLNCYITTISKDKNNIIENIEVAIFDEENYKLFPITYRISVNNIESMLITEKAYTIQQI